jgi:hypothetical protein
MGDVVSTTGEALMDMLRADENVRGYVVVREVDACGA